MITNNKNAVEYLSVPGSLREQKERRNTLMTGISEIKHLRRNQNIEKSAGTM